MAVVKITASLLGMFVHVWLQLQRPTSVCGFNSTCDVCHVAFLTGPSRFTGALELICILTACSSVLADGCRAVAPVNQLVAVLPLPPTCADTGVRLARRAAQPVVEARVRVTGGQEALAVGTGITGWTSAGVRVHSVIACPSIQAQTGKQRNGGEAQEICCRLLCVHMHACMSVCMFACTGECEHKDTHV